MADNFASNTTAPKTAPAPAPAPASKSAPAPKSAPANAPAGETSTPEKDQIMDIGTSKSVSVDVDVGDSNEIPVVKWTSTGSILVEADPEDPLSAKVFANIGGIGTVRATVDFAGGHTEMTSNIIVVEPSIVPTNKITFA